MMTIHELRKSLQKQMDLMMRSQTVEIGQRHCQQMKTIARQIVDVKNSRK